MLKYFSVKIINSVINFLIFKMSTPVQITNTNIDDLAMVYYLYDLKFEDSESSSSSTSNVAM
jgi:hypothetical protein